MKPISGMPHCASICDANVVRYDVVRYSHIAEEGERCLTLLVLKQFSHPKMALPSKASNCVAW